MRQISSGRLAGLGVSLFLSAVAANAQIDSSFQIRYASNLTIADAVINISNTGANGASQNGPGLGTPQGNICVNVYAFSPDEQLASCCSCLVTPNGLMSLSVVNDLLGNTLTGIRPNSATIKLFATATDLQGSFSGTTCTQTAAMVNALPPANGLVAWGTSIHLTANGTALAETQFLPATPSAAELASLANRCAFIIGNGSLYGICRSCRAGGLGAGRL